MKKLTIGLYIVFAGLYALKGNAQTISTVAGNGSSGYSGDGSPAITAKIRYAQSVTVDGAGNLFIADLRNNRIRKVSATGIISTVAGNGYVVDTILFDGAFSGDGGPATAAQLSKPADVAVDAAGNIYIADRGNARIRKVNTSGIITTIAGNGSFTYSGDGGAAISAGINPHGIALDASGNIYVADVSNNRIRKISTSGVVSTVAGNGTAGFTGDGSLAVFAQIHQPTGIAVDGGGNLYISDHANKRVRKVNTAGIISTYVGVGVDGYSGDGGPATMANFTSQYPAHLSVDAAGNLFLPEGNDVVRKVNTSGVISTVAGNGTYGFSGDGGPATSAQCGNPSGVAVDGYGNLYIAEPGNNRIRKVAGAGSTNIIAVTNQTGFSQITPNPSKGQFSLYLESERNEPVQVAIYNSIGQKVKEIYGATNVTMNQSVALPAGLYIVSGESEHCRYINKLTIE